MYDFIPPYMPYAWYFPIYIIYVGKYHTYGGKRSYITTKICILFLWENWNKWQFFVNKEEKNMKPSELVYEILILKSLGWSILVHNFREKQKIFYICKKDLFFREVDRTFFSEIWILTNPQNNKKSKSFPMCYLDLVHKKIIKDIF